MQLKWPQMDQSHNLGTICNQLSQLLLPSSVLILILGIYQTQGGCFVQNPALEGCIPNFNLTISTQKVYMDFHLNWRPKQLPSGEKQQLFKTICLNLNDIFMIGIIQKLFRFLFHVAV